MTGKHKHKANTSRASKTQAWQAGRARHKHGKQTQAGPANTSIATRHKHAWQANTRRAQTYTHISSRHKQGEQTQAW